MYLPGRLISIAWLHGFHCHRSCLVRQLGTHAQSTVNISGLIDAGVYRGFDKVNHVGTIQRSNLAFSGSEDLGGGLAATFKLSTRFEMGAGQLQGAGSKPFWQGESTVGLKGGWSSVRLGRALDAVWANDWAYDPWGNFDRIALPAWQYWHYNYASNRTSNNGSPEYGRLANGVFYESPSVGGFTAHLSGSFENSSNPSVGRTAGHAWPVAQLRPGRGVADGGRLQERERRYRRVPGGQVHRRRLVPDGRL